MSGEYVPRVMAIGQCRELKTWHAAIELAEAVYEHTASFPNRERFGLSAQLRKSAISIVSNLAEACGRRTRRDFSRFLDDTYGSLMELETQLELSSRLQYLDPSSATALRSSTSEVGEMLNGLRRSIRS